MKTLLLVLSLSLACVAADAANLTASVINAGTGKRNGKIVLAITGGNAPYIFSWSGPGGYTASWQNPDSLGAGTYCVTVTDRYCGVAEMCVTINEVPNSIKEQSLAEVKVFPNPFGDQLHIRLAEVSAGTIHACLSDASGRIVASRDFASGKDFDWALQHSLPAGTYLLMLRPEGGEGSYTLLVRSGE